jgi:hypothetical protein
MRSVRLLVLAIVVVLLVAPAPQQVEARDCLDCFLVNTPWGTEWACLSLGGSAWRVCQEFEDYCMLWMACWAYP